MSSVLPGSYLTIRRGQGPGICKAVPLGEDDRDLASAEGTVAPGVDEALSLQVLHGILSDCPHLAANAGAARSFRRS